MNNRGKEILDEFLKENSAYSLRYSFNGDIVRDKDLFRDYLRELIKENEKMHSIIKEVREEIEELEYIDYNEYNLNVCINHIKRIICNKTNPRH